MTKYQKYSKDFNLQTAKLVTEQGCSYDQTSMMATLYRQLAVPPKERRTHIMRRTRNDSE